ncbi:endothelin-converting enzyme 1-like [Anoplolepis gracilipes]|uniref:endothelin-converting enzyme 1-like n=1 Tax=Anoplolepis gracilipes TaxID=354296 RepID=UPI003BA01EDD
MHRSFIVFLVAVTYTYVTFAAPKNEDYSLCTTQNCVDTASEILARLDPTVDPCDNFYKFACGKWAKNNPANTSYPTVSSLSGIMEKTTEQIREILEDDPKPDDTLSLQKARKIYSMCMDTETLKIIGINGLNRVVEENGGWPMTMSRLEWKLRGYDKWQQISDILQDNLFDNGLYSIVVMPDDKKSDTNVITILEPTFFAPRDTVIGLGEDPSQLTKYTSFIKTVAKIFIENSGTFVDEATLSQDALDVANFEIELAKLTLTLVDSRNIDKYYNALTIKELQNAYDAQRPVNGKINWLIRIQRLFAPKKITSSERLVVHAYKYLTNLVPLLERTPIHTIVNYMQWNVIRGLLPYTERTEQIAIELAKHFKGEKEENSRWKTCVSQPNLDSAISYEYAKRFVKHENKEDLTDIITNIENAVGESISGSTWMDETTKKASLEKLAYMKMQVLTPNWYSNEAIDKYYNGLTVTWEYLESVLNILKYETKRMLNNLGKPVDKDQWLMEPTVVNAYYNPSSNEFVITAAIAQDPVYDKTRPIYLNYGAVGVVIGHEVNHGFDNMGSKYDKDGNAVEWWSPDAINKYKPITQCFIDQYDSYLVPGLEDLNIHVNGKLTVGENIGDSAGVVAAYHAYQNKKAKLNQPEVRLQGLEDFTDNQLFFVSFAQAFCENDTREQLIALLQNEHPRGETRIRGSLSNFPEFSTVYNCPAGKGMNPEKKCSLW